MRRFFDSELARVDAPGVEPAAANTYLVSLVRAMLQYMAATALELAASAPGDQIDLRREAHALLHPNDSSYVFVLESLLPKLAARRVPGVETVRWTALRRELNRWVTYRNTLSHEIANPALHAEGLLLGRSVSTALLAVLGSLLPSVQSDGRLLATNVNGVRVPITILHVVDGTPALYREVVRVGDVWNAKAARIVFDGYAKRRQVPLAAGNAFERLLGSEQTLFIDRLVPDRNGTLVAVRCCVPERVTAARRGVADTRPSSRQTPRRDGGGAVSSASPARARAAAAGP